MRKKILSISTAFLAVMSICLAFCIKTANLDNKNITVNVEPTAAAVENGIVENAQADVKTAEPQVASKTDAVSVEDKLLAMLNINYCYGDAFYNDSRMVMASSISLLEYAADYPGYGICVSKTLINGFAEDFYGKELSFAGIDTDAPNGYVATPCAEYGIQYHEIVSITATEDGYELITRMHLYYGGSSQDISFARSVFTENSESQFGFNLVSCELF